MENSISLFGEICSAAQLNSDAQKKIWDALQKYNVNISHNEDNFSFFSDKFLKSKKYEGCSPATLDNYRIVLNVFEGFINDKPIGDIGVEDIHEYIEYLKTVKKIKNSSITQYLRIIRTLFNWLEDRGYISDNPLRQIKNLQPDVKCREALTDEEIEMIKNAKISIRNKAIVEFFLSTGCRLSEVLTLNYEDLNFEDNCVLLTVRLILFICKVLLSY